MLRSVLQNSTLGFYIFASDSTTPTTGKTGLTLTITLSKSGAAASTVAPSQSEIGNGLYWITPIAAHRDTLGEIAWQFSASGAIIAPRLEKVVAVNDQTAVWGANTVAPATPANVSAVQTHGDSAWATATGFATVNPDNAAIVAGAAAAVTVANALPTSGFLAGAADAGGAAVLDAVTQQQIVNSVLTTVLTESYAVDGASPTLTQAILLVLQHMSESSINGVTKTVKKLDGNTTAATFTLNSATTPTTITRTT